MNQFLACLILAVSMAGLSQRAVPQSALEKPVMITAVSRDDSVLVGGVGSGDLIPDEKLDVVPLAWLTPSGDWKAIRCDMDHPQACRQFDREYLRKPHTYVVVSHDGWNAKVHVEQMSLDDECFGIYGAGTYSGPAIHFAAVAASAADLFASANPPVLLTGSYADTVRHAFIQAAGPKLDSARNLRVYSLHLEGQDFFAIERIFRTIPPTPQGVAISNWSSPSEQ